MLNANLLYKSELLGLKNGGTLTRNCTLCTNPDPRIILRNSHNYLYTANHTKDNFDIDKNLSDFKHYAAIIIVSHSADTINTWDMTDTCRAITLFPQGVEGIFTPLFHTFHYPQKEYYKASKVWK